MKLITPYVSFPLSHVLSCDLLVVQDAMVTLGGCDKTGVLWVGVALSHVTIVLQCQVW